MKDETIKTRISSAEKAELDQIGEVLDIPISQIIREGVRERVAELKRTHPALQAKETEPALAK